MNFLKGQFTAKTSSKKQLLYLKCIVVLLLSCMLVPLTSRAEYSDRYVSTSGIDTFTNGKPNNCLQFNKPCRTIQHAVDWAEWEDVIKVQAGVYTENIVVDEYKGNLTIQGGWGNGFRKRHLNPWSVTTISGSNTNPVFYIMAKSFSVVLTIDGFTLEDGSGDRGGAISAVAKSALGDGGTISGAYVIITLNNNRFRGNIARKGGAISARCINPEPGFYSNGLDLILTNNVIEDNWAWDGGAIYAYVSGSSALWVELEDNVIINNSSRYTAGAILFNANYNPGDKAKFFLKRNIIQNNVSGEEGGGLALYADLDSTAVLELENNLIAGNHSRKVCGGGIFVQNEEGDIELSLINDTITDNSCDQGGRGAGIGLSTQGLWGSIKANLVNEIVWGNHGAFDMNTSGGSVVNISYSDIGILAVGGDYNEGEGVTDVDPLFVDAPNGVYRIRPNSPVRDKGICGTINIRFGTERIAPLEDFETDPRPDPGTLDCDRWFIDPSGHRRCVKGTYFDCDMGADESIAGLITLPGIPLLLLEE